MSPYSSPEDFYDRLQKHAIDVSEKHDGRVLESFIITEDNKSMFGELDLTPAGMNEIFQENNIHLIGRLSKKSLNEYICSSERHVVCRGMSLEFWAKKMIYSDENKFKRIMSLLPTGYKNRFIEIANDILESIGPANPPGKPRLYSSVTIEEPADYFLKAIRNAGIETVEPEAARVG